MTSYFNRTNRVGKTIFVKNIWYLRSNYTYLILSYIHSHVRKTLPAIIPQYRNLAGAIGWVLFFNILIVYMEQGAHFSTDVWRSPLTWHWQCECLHPSQAIKLKSQLLYLSQSSSKCNEGLGLSCKNNQVGDTFPCGLTIRPTSSKI